MDRPVICRVGRNGSQFCPSFGSPGAPPKTRPKAPDAQKLCSKLCTDCARGYARHVSSQLSVLEALGPWLLDVRKGTPEQCLNDQVHKPILQCLRDALREVTGDRPVFRRRPRDAISLRRGGVYRTAANNPRGPTPYLYVACSRRGLNSRQLRAQCNINANIKTITLGSGTPKSRQPRAKYYINADASMIILGCGAGALTNCMQNATQPQIIL